MEKRFNGLIEGKDINSSPFDHDHESESSCVIALADALVLATLPFQVTDHNNPAVMYCSME